MMPHWNSGTRTLSMRYGPLEVEIVKRFRVPAANQIAIIQEFESLGWPKRVDDPLSPTYQQNPKLRLNETIKSLNRGQQIIRFHGDGTGGGVWWELVE